MTNVEIRTMTGSEWHSSYGAKGYVFVVDEEGQETHIQDSPVAELVDIDWVYVQRGKHGKWANSTYTIPNGTILKLFAIETRRGRPESGGGAYFVVDAEAPGVVATGGHYNGRGGQLYGRLRMLTMEELPEHITIDPKFKRYYRNKITVVDITTEEEPEAS